MTQTAAERKAKERQRKKEKGFVSKTLWLDQDTIRAISEYKAKFGCTDDEAVNSLIIKALD